MAELAVFTIDVQPVTKRLGDLSRQILENKDALKQMTEGLAGSALEAKKTSQEYLAQQASLKVVEKEYRSLNTVLVNQTAAIKEVATSVKQGVDIRKIETNSIDTNRKLYNSLYGEYVRAGKEQREKMIPTLKALSDELKKQEAAVGDTRRNVGNYAEGFVDAAKELNVFGVSLGGVKKGLDASKQGFQAAGGGVKGFAAALATTGLPLIIMAITQLTSAFEAFKPVADAVESTVVGLKAAFGALITGGSISEAVKQSQALLEVMRNLEDTQGAFNLQTEKNRNEIERLIISSKDRTKTEAQRLADLEKAEALEKQLYDNSVKRNNDLLVQQQSNLKNKFKISDAELKLLAETTGAQALALRDRLEEEKGLTDKELEDYQKTLQDRAKLEGDSAKFFEKAINAKNKIVEKEEAAQEKAAAAQAARQEKIKAENEKRQADIAKLQEEFLLSERQKIEKSFTDKEALIPKSEVKLLAAINAAKKAALDKFDADADAKRTAEFDKNRAEIIAAETALINEQITLNQTLLENELKAVDLSVASEQDKANRKIAIQLDYLNQQLTLAEKLADVDNKRTDLEKANIDKIKLAIEELKQKVTEPTPKISEILGIDEKELGDAAAALGGFQQLVGTIQQTLSAINQQRITDIETQYDTEIENVNRSSLNKEEKEKKIKELERQRAKEKYEIELQAFNTNKALQIVQATIATALAVIQGLQAGFSMGPAGVVLGPVLAAAAGVAGAVQIGIIAAQNHLHLQRLQTV